MRRLFLLVIVALGWAFPVAAQDTDRILVTFADPGMSNAARAGPPRPGYNRRTSTYLISQGVKRAADKVAREFGLDVVDEWPILPLNVHCLVYQVPAGTGVESLLDKLRERPEVESAQPLNTFEVSGELGHHGIDPYTELQHNLGTLELITAHAWSRGSGSSVTIIDTGADIHHPELRTQISTHHDFNGSKNFVLEVSVSHRLWKFFQRLKAFWQDDCPVQVLCCSAWLHALVSALEGSSEAGEEAGPV